MVTKRALVIAAHGAHEGSAANAFVRDCARIIARRGGFDEVSPAFRLGEPTFATVLDRIRAADVTVVPLMTSRGYYCDEFLPRELQRNGRFNAVRLTLTPPIGTRPELADAAGRRIQHLLATYRLPPEHTSVVVVGHGTARHAASRDATIRFATDLEAVQPCDQVLPSFLDDEPSFEGVVRSVSRPSVLVVPFLIGGGYHASGDLCDRLGIPPATDESVPDERYQSRARKEAVRSRRRIPLPDGRGSVNRAISQTRFGARSFAGDAGGRFVVLDIPVGFYPEIVSIIAELARPTPSVQEAASDPSRDRQGAEFAVETGPLPYGRGSDKVVHIYDTSHAIEVSS